RTWAPGWCGRAWPFATPGTPKPPIWSRRPQPGGRRRASGPETSPGPRTGAASAGEGSDARGGKFVRACDCAPCLGDSFPMNRSLDHLPSLKRAELLRVVDVLKSSFSEAMSTRRADRLKNGRILKIILYGSYARGDWVHDPVERYFSDFDILIVVDHEDLTDSEIWDAALWRTTPGVSRLRTPVSFIVHSLDDVNHQLERGRSFFADILRE